MKILHVISSSGLYGAEAVILSLLAGLAAGPVQAALAVFLSRPDNPPPPLLALARDQGFEAHALPCRGPLDPAVPAKLRRLVHTTGATLVHAHGYKADAYAYWALHGSGVPLVSTCHTWYDNDLALRLYGALDRRILRRFSRVVAVSDQVRQRLLHAGVAPGRIVLIRNGVDITGFTPGPADPGPAAPVTADPGPADPDPADPGPATPSPATPGPVDPDQAASSPVAPDPDAPGPAAPSTGPLRFGLVGRLAPEKGVDLFIQAAALVHRQWPASRFAIAGDGPDREELEALVQQLGLSHCVALLGRQDDMRAFYSSVNVLVSASRQEGLPIALLEGMALGLPLVGTAAGAVPLLIQQGETGLLVPTEDAAALAGAMLTMARQPGLRQRCGRAARLLVVQEFSSRRMLDDYLQVYAEALGTAHA